jgi:two-component system, chemotaxis family, CheB/CheR fusion protein
MPLTIPFAAERSAPAPKQAPAEPRPSLTQVIQEALLEAYAPAAAVAINESHEILYYSGPTNRYLRHARGIATQNLLDLVPENLRNRLRGGLYRAGQEAKPVSIRVSITDEHERKRHVSIRISKVQEHVFLVIFKEKPIVKKELAETTRRVLDGRKAEV